MHHPSKNPEEYKQVLCNPILMKRFQKIVKLKEIEQRTRILRQQLQEFHANFVCIENVDVLKGCLSLPAFWFWTCIKAQLATCPKSFTLLSLLETELLFFLILRKNDPYQRYWLCWSLPLCLYCKWLCSCRGVTLRDHKSTCLTVDISGEQFTAKNRLTNRWAFQNLSKLQFPYRGYNSMNNIRAVVKRLYDEKDGDVANIDVLGHSAPKYTDLYELSQQVPVSCGNHLNGDDSSCSKRISFTFAKYLESVEESQWQTEDGKKEEEEEEKVVIDCRDRVLDKICFSKHNVQYTILLK
ncbi:hypothetical protein CEXT_246131 [Caerostris extrusa]|uniref:Uncharacterized protein n=1 Tax=Caerostris extrusa TaxID=172846 RepID=A0AAV4VTG9_CAEEX|nr:hypothetical protein CEXT_246131 [Caerostris extrusa]